MYSRLKQSKRALSFVLALALVLNIVLSSGFFHVAVQAADEDEPKVIYVDGVGAADGADGSTAEKAYKTIAEAYRDIPSGNKKTVIVICGKVDMRAADAGMSTAGSYCYYAAPDVRYEGEVVFTSTWGETNYKDTKGAQLNTPQYYMLMSDTTFENIHITSRPFALYANYYNLCIGEGVTTNGYTETLQPNCFARNIYLGTSSAIFNAIRDDENVGLTGIYAQEDVNFTMKGCCSVDNLYGHGATYQGDGNNGKSFGATINIEGGKVDNLVVSNSDLTTKVNALNVLIGTNATVSAMTLGASDFITGTKTITYKDKTGDGFVAGFDVLELINSNITVDSLDTVETIKTTDTSNLTVQGEITDAVNVAVTKAGHKWTANGALITAPADTAEGMFKMTNADGCAWEYANGTYATWTVVADPDAFYVDGEYGDDTNEGLTADKPLKTLAAAYEKVTASTTTYIVICGEVHLAESLVNASAKVTRQAIGNANGGIKHPGTVVLTSKYKGADYRDVGAGLNLGYVEWDLLGNTVLENINILKDAKRITANYFTLHFGKGIGVCADGNNRVAEYVTLGYYLNSLYNESVLTHWARDIEFTMESGAIGTLYGTGEKNQGWNNTVNHNGYVAYNVTLNIEGGEIGLMYAAAAYANWPVNDINIYVGGNAVVKKMIAKNGTPTINGEATCILDLNGRDLTFAMSDQIIKVYVIDTANKAASGEGAGTLTLSEGYDMVQKIAQDPVTKMRYAAIKSNGVYTANPFNLTIAQAGLNTKAGEGNDEVALCLRAMYLANDLAKPTDFGISYVDEGGVWQDISAAGSAYSFDGKNLVNAFYNLTGALEELDKTASYRVYMKVNGVTVYSGVAAITPATVLAGINSQLLDNKVTPTVAQTAVIQEKLAGTEAAEHLSYFFPAN